MPAPAIELQGIHKTYPATGQAPATHALKGIDLRIDPGAIFCILGPNGAGKTTLISIMAGLLYPDAGTGRICELNLVRQQRKIRAIVNFASGHANFPDIFTVDETLNYFGMLYGLPGKQRKKKADELTRLFELGPYRRTPFNQLSTGLKQRLALAKSLLNDPRVLFLDEPTVGLDPRVSLQIRSRLRELNQASGTTIILTTHQMDEAEQLSDRIAFLKEGEFVRIGKPEELKKSIRFQERITIRGNNLDSLRGVLGRIPGVSHIELDQTGLSCRIDSREARLQLVLQGVIEAGAVVEHIEIAEPSLGDVFLALADPSNTD